MKPPLVARNSVSNPNDGIAGLRMECPNCGHEPPPESGYCNKCGHSLPTLKGRTIIGRKPGEVPSLLLGFSVYGKYRWLLRVGALIFFLLLIIMPVIISLYHSK